MNDNPLLDFSDAAALRRRAARARRRPPSTRSSPRAGTIERARGPGRAPTWETFVEPLDDANEKLGRAWAQVSHLNAVMNTPARCARHTTPRCRRSRSSSPSRARTSACTRASRRCVRQQRSRGSRASRKRIVENQLRDFRLGGAELPPPQKARFLAIQEELAQLASRFQDNVLDATNAFGLYVTDRAELAGIPEDVIATAREAAAEGGRDGWKLTLHMPSLPAGDAVRRQPRAARDACTARIRHPRLRVRASPSGTTTPNIVRILELRAEEAQLLGYALFRRGVARDQDGAARRPRCSSSCDDLARARSPSPSATWRSCAISRATELGLAELRAWDVAYASREAARRRATRSPTRR